MRHISRALCFPALCLLVLGALARPAVASPASAPPARPAGAASPLGPAFAAAAREFGVPERVLLAVSYNLSRWDDHGGAPSVAGGYGPMHLTHVAAVPNFDARGDDARAARAPAAQPALHTLDAAAALLGLPAATLMRDPAQNIRGGAALLAQLARGANGALPASEADWYAAVAAYSYASDPATAADFADAVFATIQQGVARTLASGETITLAPANVVPNRPLALAQAARSARLVDCPQRMPCEWVPAAYVLNNPADPSDYGNYDLADRPKDGLDIRYIVIHDTEVDYATTLQIFQNPLNYVSTHYVVRSSDGHVAQMVGTQNVAWHAGNWYVNGHSVGIEHEGFAIAGAAWYSEPMYRASARLVHYLAVRYHIPLDRAHIIGHDDIPHPTQSQGIMHWDPGPFWDWAHYMELLGAPFDETRDRGSSRGIVTIAPAFAGNQQGVLDCEGGTTVAPQASNFLLLRTAPSADAAYVANPYLPGVDPLCANNWGDKAVAGQQFYRFARSGDWDGIYFGGQEAWFYNPHRQYTAGGEGMLVQPRAGLASIPVYGRAYPEDAAYPAGTTPQLVAPIGLYSMPAGQRYVAIGPFSSDYYWAPTYAPTLAGSDHVVVKGQTQYYQIFFNHRIAFVQASDVQVVK